MALYYNFNIEVDIVSILFKCGIKSKYYSTYLVIKLKKMLLSQRPIFIITYLI